MNDKISKFYSNEDLSPLSKVTLVIPTYNRNFYLSRCLWYNAHFPFAEIIVADSSCKEKREINKKTIDELSRFFQIKITHLKYDYPPEEYGGEIYRKWSDAVNHVTTKYTLSHPDRGFIIPTTIVNCVKFLNEHLDYSIADGDGYLMQSRKKIGTYRYNDSITDDSPFERLKKTTLSPLGMQYGLHRTNEYIKIFENMNKYELFDIRFGETLLDIFPLLQGKLNKTNDPMSVRDVTEYDKQNTIINYITNNLKKMKAESSFSRYKSYHEYPIERRNKLLYKFKDCIENTIKINENIDFYNNILNVRYNIRNVNNNSIISIIKTKLFDLWWNYLTPYKLRYSLSHFLGSGRVDKRINPKDVPENIMYIFNIIEETRKYITTDTPITQTSIFQGDIR